MQVLEVGKRYPLEGGYPRPEQVEFNYDAAGLVLRVLLPGIKKPEVKAIRDGDADFALAVEGPVIFFLYRFRDALAWSDAPYNVHLIGEERRRTTLATPEGGLRCTLSIHIVDATSGVLRAIRLAGLPREFTEAFEGALQGQVVEGWCGDDAYDAALAETYQRYSSEELLARAVARSSFPEEAR